MRILVVDDNDTNRLLASMMLDGRGWSLAEAVSGEQALEALDRENYDVVLLDISMPGVSGEDVCRRIKARPGGPRVVAFTAHVMQNEVAQIMSAGFDGLITKPFSEEQLLKGLWGD